MRVSDRFRSLTTSSSLLRKPGIIIVIVIDMKYLALLFDFVRQQTCCKHTRKKNLQVFIHFLLHVKSSLESFTRVSRYHITSVKEFTLAFAWKTNK